MAQLDDVGKLVLQGKSDGQLAIDASATRIDTAVNNIMIPVMVHDIKIIGKLFKYSGEKDEVMMNDELSDKLTKWC